MSENRTFEVDFDLKPEVYQAWLETLVSTDDTLGGALRFPDTRLSVEDIGSSIFNSQDKYARMREVLEDYDYISRKDIFFSFVYMLNRKGFLDWESKTLDQG